jgi:dTDP-glucose pyrophosphorylase
VSLNPGLALLPSATVREALEAITKNGRQAVAVTDEAGRLAGILTDGDVRRGMLRGASLDSAVQDVMNRRPVVGPANLTRDAALAFMQRREIRHLPLVDAGRRLVDLVFLDDLLRPAPLPNAAVIMAGGEGRRLRPLTEAMPKPLLRVGGKPLVEIMIDRLRTAGVEEIWLTLHYKAHMIEDHFGDGARHGVRIRYHWEEQPRGTAGSLRDLSQDLRHPFLLVNSDILTKCNFRDMLAFHEAHGAAMTVGTVPYAVDLPYGVLQVDGNELAGVTEKPRVDFMINSGLYVVDPAAVELAIPPGATCDVPDMITRLMTLRRRVVAFPIREYWLDVGRLDDFQKADRDVAEGLLE